MKPASYEIPDIALSTQIVELCANLSVSINKLACVWDGDVANFKFIHRFPGGYARALAVPSNTSIRALSKVTAARSPEANEVRCDLAG